jgi:hypothetical protein
VAGAPRGRESDGARLDSLADVARHRLEVVLARGPVEGPLAHHVSPDRGMADIARVVDALRQAVEHVEEFRKRLPAPFDAGAHGLAAQVLRTLEIAEHQVGLALAAGRQRESAVPHHDGGDAVIAGAGADRIPEHLGVHVGVAVDEAGRHHMALGVDGLARRRRDAPDERDLARLDADVGAIGRQAGAVDHHAVLDQEVVAHRSRPRCQAVMLARRTFHWNPDPPGGHRHRHHDVPRPETRGAAPEGRLPTSQGRIDDDKVRRLPLARAARVSS